MTENGRFEGMPDLPLGVMPGAGGSGGGSGGSAGGGSSNGGGGNGAAAATIGHSAEAAELVCMGFERSLVEATRR